MGFIVKIGSTDSFYAELWGLREDLRLVRERGFGKVVVKIVNESAINIMKRESDYEEDATYLIRDCKHLVEGWNSIHYTHVRREGNKCVDYLANLGQQGEWGMSYLEDSPGGLVELLQANTGGVSTRRIW